jgi:hypothetical protein
MTTRTSAGTTFKVSASTPATWDAVGYAALTYTTVGEITNFGEFGRVRLDGARLVVDAEPPVPGLAPDLAERDVVRPGAVTEVDSSCLSVYSDYGHGFLVLS